MVGFSVVLIWCCTAWLTDGLVDSGGFVFVVSLRFVLVVCGWLFAFVGGFVWETVVLV